MKRMLRGSVVFLLSLSLLSSICVADAWQDKYMLLLNGRMVTAVEKYAKGFDVTRSPRVQAHLLDEDILWANSTSEEKDRALCVALALHIAKGRAIEELAAEDKLERVRWIRAFLDKVDDEIKKWRKKCEGIKDARVARINFTY